MPKLLFLLCLLTTVNYIQLDPITYELTATIATLNQGLESKTNVIYMESSQSLDVQVQISQTLSQVPSILLNNNYNSLVNISTILSEPLLMIIVQPNLKQTLHIFEHLPEKFQRSDFLFVGIATAAKWLQLLSSLWQLGYPNVLIYNMTELERGVLYTSDSFPHQQLGSCSIAQYLWARRHWFDNLRDWEVRVALYNNPPRSLVYPEEQLFDGYALMLLRQFLAYRKLKFVPVLTPDYKVYSPNDCFEFLRLNQTDICGDLLAYNTDFSYTASYQYLYGNILIPTALPRSKNYYIVAPMQLKTWLLVSIYAAVICCFSSFICWLQHGRWEFGTLLLEILCSLLSAGFQLKQIVGKQHYILFSTIFLAGFIACNYYLAFLKTILSTGLYEPQITSFEELVNRNITFIIGDYDKTVLKTYDFPDILWNITRVVPYNFILQHRRILDTSYAYLAHSDRLVLFKYQQQYMVKPRMRPLPIDLMHSLPGFPMRRAWLLKYELSETLLNSFASGLMQKLAADTNLQTIHIGYLPIIPSEQYEARPLTLDFFNMPLMMLALGIILAAVCLLGELLWRLVEQYSSKRQKGIIWMDNL